MKDLHTFLFCDPHKKSRPSMGGGAVTRKARFLMTQTHCNKGKSTGQAVFNQKGKAVGLVKDGVFVRSFRSEHMLQKPPALAFDLVSLGQIQALKVKTLRLTNTESGEVYSVFLSTFLEHSFPIDRGFGEQRALPLKYWHCDPPTPTDPPTPSGSAPQTFNEWKAARRKESKRQAARQLWLLKF